MADSATVTTMIGSHTNVNVSCIVSVKLRSIHRELIGKNG